MAMCHLVPSRLVPTWHAQRVVGDRRPEASSCTSTCSTCERCDEELLGHRFRCDSGHAERSRCRVRQQARDPAQHYLALCVVGASPISVCLVLEGFQRQTWGNRRFPAASIALVEPIRCNVASLCSLATRAQQSVCLDFGFLSRDIRCMEHGSSTATFCSSQSLSGVAVLVVSAIQLLETVAAQIVADGRSPLG